METALIAYDNNTVHKCINTKTENYVYFVCMICMVSLKQNIEERYIIARPPTKQNIHKVFWVVISDIPKYLKG